MGGIETDRDTPRASGEDVTPQPLDASSRAPLTVEDYEALARERMEATAFDYYAGGAGDEWTVRENRRAFDRWIIRPRVMVDVSGVKLGTTVLGHDLPMPLMLAPTALHRLAHPEGEMATARAAAAMKVPMILSTMSSVSMEDVAGAGGPRWFQLYIHRDRSVSAELVARAAAAGYTAIVLTADVPFLGRRYRDERNAFSLPADVALANLVGRRLPETGGSDMFSYVLDELDPTVTWRDVAWIRSVANLPIVVKGILTAEDAKLAVQSGAQGVVVSNHGGRQLDGTPATLDVLPEVAAAVAGRAAVLMDGGVRRGTDVLKALALGARAVLVGRAYLWGLAAGGEAGVRGVLEILRNELTLAMALAGRTNVRDLSRSVVAPAAG